MHAIFSCFSFRHIDMLAHPINPSYSLNLPRGRDRENCLGKQLGKERRRQLRQQLGKQLGKQLRLRRMLQLKLEGHMHWQLWLAHLSQMHYCRRFLSKLPWRRERLHGNKMFESFTAWPSCLPTTSFPLPGTCYVQQFTPISTEEYVPLSRV